MNVRQALGLLATLATCCLPARSAAGDLEAIASWKLNDRHVQWVALSPDGTRLAAAVWYVDARPKTKELLSAVVIWDLTTAKQLSPEDPGPPFTRYSFLFFSANGKTLVAVDDGDNGNGGDAHIDGGLRTGRGYQTWDATTGREIGSRIAPPPSGLCTAAAVSPDGKYLAVVSNAEPNRSIPPRPFPVREVAVWDIQDHKVKWKLPGVGHTGKVLWSDSLAFSPDGKKLALGIHGAGGPSSESTTRAHPDRPDGNLSRLRMLTLEEGKDEPASATLELGAPLKGKLQWPSRGKRFVARTGRLLEFHDPATGERKGTLALQFPPLGGPKGKDNNTPAAPPDSTDVPEGWQLGVAVLSADGSRLAAHFRRSFDDPAKPLKHRVIIWEVPRGEVRGVVALPDERMSAEADKKPETKVYDSGTPVQIALSGDGGRLAVGGVWGAVQVYDVAKISGVVIAVPAGAAAKGPDDPAAVRTAYEGSVAKARERLLARLDDQIHRLEKDDKGQAALARLKNGRERFDKHDLVPWSEETWADTGAYLAAVRDARARVLAAYGSAELPGDLRDLLDKRVVARWVHQPGGKVTLYSSGAVNDPTGGNTWSFENGVLTFRWKGAKAPGGYWVDTCRLAADGLSYAGANQIKTKVSGTLVTDD
jgi:hypothetical protein